MEASHDEEKGRVADIDVSERPKISRSGVRSGPSMEITTFAIQEEGKLDESEITLKDIVSQNNNFYWVDATAVGDLRDDHQFDMLQNEIHTKVLDLLPLPPLLLRHSCPRKDNHQHLHALTTQVLPMKKVCLVVMRVVSPDSDDNQVRHAVILCLPKILVTIASIPVAGVNTDLSRSYRYVAIQQEQKLERIMCERELPESSSTGAFLLLMSIHLHQTSASVLKIRTRIFQLIELQDSSEVPLYEIVNVKDELLKVISVAEEQNECIQALQDAAELTDGLQLSSNGVQAFVRTLQSTAGATERMALRLEKRVADLRSAYDAQQQELVNRRLGVLTILSAVFLPLSLMAGVRLTSDAMLFI